MNVWINWRMEKNLTNRWHQSRPQTVAAPDLLDPKSATSNSKPRLSFSTKPVVLNAPEDECDTRTTVMRWKTVSAIFFLVVLYLIIGATVFKALEQPHENLQKIAILEKKIDFLTTHSCVNSSELEDLMKVRISSLRNIIFSIPKDGIMTSGIHYQPWEIRTFCADIFTVNRDVLGNTVFHAFEIWNEKIKIK